MKRTKCRNIQTAVSNFERQQVQHCARLERMDSSIQRMTVLEKYYVGVRYQVQLTFLLLRCIFFLVENSFFLDFLKTGESSEKQFVDSRNVRYQSINQSI